MRSSDLRARATRLVRAIGSLPVVASAWLAVNATTALAASPSPSAAPAGDPRSSGQGPGLVGDPLLAIAIVAAIGLASLAVTLLYVRATRRPGGA
jgi:hypothetical protein